MLFDFMLQLTEVNSVFGKKKKKHALKFEYLKKKKEGSNFFIHIFQFRI